MYRLQTATEEMDSKQLGNCGLNHRLGTCVLDGTICQLKLTC